MGETPAVLLHLCAETILFSLLHRRAFGFETSMAIADLGPLMAGFG